jgi:AhpD family alkylhydroperoxidase
MAGALADVEWDACVLEPRRDRDLEAYVRRELGTVPSAVAYFTPVPWVVRSMATFAPSGSPLLHIDSVLPDLVGLVVSQDNSCRYCFGVQRLMLRIHGISDARIRQLEHGFIEAEIDPKLRAALDFARRLSRASPVVSEVDTSALRAAGWSTEAIREIAFCAAYDVYMNRLMTSAAIPYAPVESLADQWVVRLVTPVMRWSGRRRQRRSLARAALLPPERARGPWAYLVGAFDTLSMARTLRETLDAALASPVLPKRAKALIFAVVARGLECAPAAREANDLLESTGMAGYTIESILTHLGGPELTAVENALVPYARSSIRGRPQQLQQRTRALLDVLSQAQLVEAVAVCALANLITRLDVVTEV